MSNEGRYSSYILAVEGRRKAEANLATATKQLDEARGDAARLRAALEAVELRALECERTFNSKNEASDIWRIARAALTGTPAAPAPAPKPIPWQKCQWCGNNTREGEREFCPAWPGTEQKCHEAAPAPGAVLDPLVEAAREVRRVRDAQVAYTRELQRLAAEARKTGKSQSHRIPPRVHDYGDCIAALLTALEGYERAITSTGDK